MASKNILQAQPPPPDSKAHLVGIFLSSPTL